MEAPTDPKPKRKYVMTPERHAKIMANLAKARLAPKEKVYRKTPKRYAANIGNLEKAKAKLHQESESQQADLREKLESLFPPSEVPPPPIVTSYGPAFGPMGPMGAPGSQELDQAAALIAKRLRKVQAGWRRDGRQIMRLLTAAISQSHPLSAEEACKLVNQLLDCLDGSRVVTEARRLNEKIEHLLLKMIETRYGAEAPFGGAPVATIVEQLMEERRQRAAMRREAREAKAGREGQPAMSGENVPAPAEGNAARTPEAELEIGKGNPGGQPAKPKQASTLKLPATLEKFQGLLARALDLESEDGAILAGMLARLLWERLQWWKWREQKEAQQLDQLFQEGAATSPDLPEDLGRRRTYLNICLLMDDFFVARMDDITKNLDDDTEWWLKRRAQIVQARQKSPAAAPPGKPAVSAPPNQAAGGSAAA